MKRAIIHLLTLGLMILVPVAALGGSAKVKLKVMDEQGAPVSGALFVFSQAGDPENSFSVDENDAGVYETTVQLPGDDTSWNLTRIVAAGYLPVEVGIRARPAKGDPLQQVDGMVLNPGIPIPAVRILSGGRVEIDLTLGDQREVMAKFLEARKQARAKAEEEARAQETAGGPQGAYAEALSLYNEGAVDEALERFGQAVEEDPGNLEIRVTHAKLLYRAGRAEEFRNAARAALELDPGNRELLMMLYSSHRERGEMQPALEALLAIKKLGGGADLLPHLRFVAQSMGRSKQAIRAYETILELDAGDADACVVLASLHLKAGETSASDRYLEQAVSLAPARAPKLYLDTASHLLGDPAIGADGLVRVEQLLRKSIDRDPKFAPAYRMLGLALWKRQDYAGARQSFRDYLELKPGAEDRAQIEEYLSQLSE